MKVEMESFKLKLFKVRSDGKIASTPHYFTLGENRDFKYAMRLACHSDEDYPVYFPKIILNLINMDLSEIGKVFYKNFDVTSEFIESLKEAYVLFESDCLEEKKNLQLEMERIEENYKNKVGDILYAVTEKADDESRYELLLMKMKSLDSKGMFVNYYLSDFNPSELPSSEINEEALLKILKEKIKKYL